MKKALAAALLIAFVTAGLIGLSEEAHRPEYRVPKTEDFEVTGTGSNPAWQSAKWARLTRREEDGGDELPYWARFKLLYSDTGIYCVMEGSDELLTTTGKEDFADLWTEDVFEIFLWPDEKHPLYFEYEISPMGKELAILVPNLDGKYLGWRPWFYDGERKARKKTSVIGNEHGPGAIVKGWTAEFFIPFQLLRPLRNVPPKKGMRWRANLYRMDHDHARHTKWEWASAGGNFHAFERFGALVFD